MRLVPVKCLRTDSEIAVDVINNDGKLMLKEGQKVTSKGIETLEKIGISYVYINDEYCFSNKKNKYSTKIDYFYKSIRQLEKLANKSISGEASFSDIQDTMYIATQFVDDVLAAQDSLKISYEPNKLSVNPFIEQTIYVAIMAVILGAKMKLSKDKLVKLCIATLLKDIALVSPNAKLAYDVVYIQHPVLGYKYLKKKYAIDEEILEAILHHHERSDGSGFPNKLKGEEISLLARIISVVDTFYEIKVNHKMLGNTHGVLEENLKKIFKKLDMDVLGYFLKNVEIFTLDSMVILNNGDIGVIIKNNDRNPFKPCVKIVKSSHNLEGQIIDLFEHTNLGIKNLTYYVS